MTSVIDETYIQNIRNTLKSKINELPSVLDKSSIRIFNVKTVNIKV